MKHLIMIHVVLFRDSKISTNTINKLNYIKSILNICLELYMQLGYIKNTKKPY